MSLNVSANDDFIGAIRRIDCENAFFGKVECCFLGNCLAAFNILCYALNLCLYIVVLMSMMKDEQTLRAMIEALSESAKVDLIIN